MLILSLEPWEDPKWDESEKRTKTGTGHFRFRKRLGLYANLRPILFQCLGIDSSPNKKRNISGNGARYMLISVRELTGGLIFWSEPKGIDVKTKAKVRAFDTMEYTYEVKLERVAQPCF
jgi:3-isopropylmalate dehydrogenase